MDIGTKLAQQNAAVLTTQQQIEVVNKKLATDPNNGSLLTLKTRLRTKLKRQSENLEATRLEAELFGENVDINQLSIEEPSKDTPRKK